MSRAKPINSDLITRAYFDELLLEMRHIDGATPDTSMTLYGEKFDTPVMMAALSHLKGKGGEGDGMVQMALGAKAVNCVNWSGMGEIEWFDDIAATGARSIKIIKPYDDEKMVLDRMERAEAAGAFAIGMDLDHSFGADGNPDLVIDWTMRPRTVKDLEGYVKRTKLPFIIKGVLSAVDAQKCLDAGVQGIVVSHHHSLMHSAVPPLMVLPEIAKVINGRIPIFVDCCFENGMDVFKALALGATAVSVGRPVIQPILDNGAEGAAQTIREITAELKGTMARTGCKTLADIDSSIIWHKSGRRIL